MPVFINEAAYGEKGIAMSLTRQQVLQVRAGWGESLEVLAVQLAVAGER